MDLQQIVMEQFAKIQSEGFVEATVEKVLKKTVEGVIDDTLRSYSDFGKGLTAAVKGALQINFDRLDIAQYNVLVLNAVSAELDRAVHIQGVEKIKEHLQELLGDPQREFKLSKLIEKMKQEVDEDDRPSGISLHVDRRSSLTFISFDEASDVSNYSCKYRLTVDNDDGYVSSVRIDNREFDNKVIMGGLHGLEAILFKLFANGSKLIIDEDAVDL